jgi:hypothetical protein
MCQANRLDGAVEFSLSPPDQLRLRRYQAPSLDLALDRGAVSTWGDG